MTDSSYTDFVLEQLAGLGPVRCRAMFGGHGLYVNDVFFAIIYNNTLYFKTDRGTVSQYVKEGMQPFEPRPGQTLKNYYEVPTKVLENADMLMAWARQAVAVDDSKK
ncbi:TfoX/Sxy family protein [Nitrospina gracilis]|uniref:TfoX/Sxy family protein n=1 Tax=Nitrospina gracilis TaxID=35801 RepID=UPI001F3A91BC|nr:TfoX/Sxy family protein [Nitrospina gracilis]MCF8720208.1 DNA transformation protein [Nitrospina gracilis Nb-211]